MNETHMQIGFSRPQKREGVRSIFITACLQSEARGQNSNQQGHRF